MSYANCSSMLEVKQLNAVNGYNWFSHGAMRWFKTRLQQGAPIGGFLFISSECQGWGHPRLYTIRAIHDDGRVETIGGFGEYNTMRQARQAANNMLADLLEKK